MRKSKILYLGSNGFPFGLAPVQRQVQIAKALHSASTELIVVNRKGIHSKNIVQGENIRFRGIYENINYIYSSGTPLYPENFIIRNLLKLVGYLGEFCIVIYFGVFSNVTCLLVNSISLSHLKYYWFLSRIIKTKLVYDYVEYISSLRDRTLNHASAKKSFDHEFIKYTDSLIVISHFLEEHIKTLSVTKQYLIVPPIIDFDKFRKTNISPPEKNYFLYCGSTHYMDVIEFIIKSYRRSESAKHDVKLILVVNGTSEELNNVSKLINGEKNIIIRSKLPYINLIGYYKHAMGLLIPLKDNLQDRARFPFKISEYTASARPIVTSDSGAIMKYFENNVNALIARTEDEYSFAEKLNYIIMEPGKANEIGKSGYAVGLRYFDYKSYTTPLRFLVN